MTTEVRAMRADEWDAWFDTVVRAFGADPAEQEERRAWRGVLEVERALTAVDGREIVGTAANYSFRLTVPGGAAVPTAGLSAVSVAPTHRRRGVLTGMMRRQLDDVRAAGEPLSVLRASEPAIYGRFGYGVASRCLGATVDTTRVSFAAPPGTDDVRLRLADPEKSLPDCEALYARLVPGRPGMLRRMSAAWERRQVRVRPGERGDASPLQCVLAERGGELVGYARYTFRPRWDDDGPHGSVRLRDLDALDPAATAALWRYLAGIDLTESIAVHDRPVDDPLQHLVSDPRRCRLRLGDQLHLRTVEVGAALAARTYTAPVDVVLDVADAFCPWNAGRWRLSGDGRGAVCERTDAPAELGLSVRELGAAYLGGVTLAELAEAGLVREERTGALAAASMAFAGTRAPWAAYGF
ncbi:MULTISPECIES: GNAT family N-acetyltransferase [unclassified Streptomyces]|uniref:GNAT family N-acetyltransferase n=1 Tax=unclassified Streptomyces TaxID=2593676 RepID=UPI0022B74170|nr:MULTISPECIES: GNAT family N-acetyltransferase [unclassified Streptomyces]MCZ7414223.1 GNAT family N-acetyltransferase [Streptomyces sp. WMMC897]MCZ7431241.1 GNAT family N-acetyltransferase [Streptomyces sp. WMMC1477]